MLCNDVSLDIIELKIPVRILECNSRMCESVNAFGSALYMPVVKEIIVKESASDKAVLINIDLKRSLKEMCYEETELCDCEAVLENRCLPVLCKFFSCLSFLT